MRGGIKTAAKYCGGFGIFTLLCGNILGGIFLFVSPAIGGGSTGEVIDYTLLEKLQQAYGTTTPQNTHRPQISATTTELDDESAERAIDLKIEQTLPAGLVSQSATSTENKIKIGSVIFALIVLTLVVRTYLRHNKSITN